MCCTPATSCGPYYRAVRTAGRRPACRRDAGVPISRRSGAPLRANRCPHGPPASAAVWCGRDNGGIVMPLTQDLGRFVSSLSFDNLPREAVEVARTGFIDTIATMIAGANDPAPQLLRRGLAPGAGPASLYFSGEGAAAPEAAWINGTAGHALDYDDV